MSTLDERVTHLVDWINHAQHGQLTTPVIEIPDCGRDDLAHAFARLGFDSGVEVGTERGLYAEVLCQANPNLQLVTVDPYLAYREYREHTSNQKLFRFWQEASERLSQFGNRVKMDMAFSVNAAQGFGDESLDFVYIDANHSLLHVIQDLHAWAPKVKRGGVVVLHDYIRRKRSGYLMHVPQAIHAYIDAYDIHPLLVLGSKEIKEGEVRDRPRTCLFVRP